MTSIHFDKAIEGLSLIIEEGEISRKCLDKVQKIITILGSTQELRLEKALSELEDMANLDMSTYHRTQVWEIISSLESIQR